MSILSSTGIGYNSPPTEEMLKTIGYDLFYNDFDSKGHSCRKAYHRKTGALLIKYTNDKRWFTWVDLNIETLRFKDGFLSKLTYLIAFNTIGQVQSFERFFNMQNNPDASETEKQEVLQQFKNSGLFVQLMNIGC